MIRPLSAAALASVLVLVSAFLAAAPQSEPPILALAREAIGGPARLQVKTVSFRGSVETVSVVRVARNDATKEAFASRIAIDGQLVLPDSFRIRRNWPGGAESVNGLDGGTVRYVSWLAGDQRLVRDSAFAQTTMRAPFQRAMLRLLVTWLLVPEGVFPVRYQDAGQVETADGLADAVDVKGPDDLAARLFFDKTTHRLFLMTWQEAPPSQIKLPRVPELRTVPPAQETGSTPHRDLIFKGLESDPTFSGFEPPAPVRIEMRLADFRLTDGILFPHTMTMVQSTDASETWRIASFKVNQPRDARLFDRK